ncbi:Leucine-responsive regulatory protein [Sodalis praecaptivus]
MMVDNKKRPGKDLDRIDRNILNELQKDGRISNVELSKRVGLSPTPVWNACAAWSARVSSRGIPRC